ncbi:MAG: glycosyltransferase family 1 protein [Candidatus Micrarchaeia archaeon]
MLVNLFTGYCPKEIYGLSRYDLNLLTNLSARNNLVCMNRIFLPFDVIRYNFIKSPIADINHVTNETFAYALKGIKGKKIITIHDLAVLTLKYEYPYLQRKFYYYIASNIKLANHIIAISNFTKNQIKDIFKIDDEKISVIYHGVESKFLSEPKVLHQKRKYNLIYVGNEKTHKNFIQVLEVMNLLKKYGAFKLIKIGKPQSQNRGTHLQYVDKNKLDVDFLDYLDETELINKYRQSDIFITMSDYEGFCFPVLEAAASGIPLVLKDNSTLREIYGKAAIFVNSPQEAVENILTLLSSENKYKIYAKKANDLAKSFTWKKCVNEVEKVYQMI